MFGLREVFDFPRIKTASAAAQPCLNLLLLIKIPE